MIEVDKIGLGGCGLAGSACRPVCSSRRENDEKLRRKTMLAHNYMWGECDGEVKFLFRLDCLNNCTER